jgi:hypothetical protein
MGNEVKITARSLTVAAVMTLAIAGCSHEKADWTSATLANTSEAYQNFLQQYPHGREATEAQARAKQLIEARDWQNATDSNTREAYQQFMDQHPDSKWNQEAKIRVENFAQADGGAAAVARATPAAQAPAPQVGDVNVPAAVKDGTATDGAKAPAAEIATAKHSARMSARARTDSSGQWVQLGAFDSRARAESHWKVLASEYGELKPLQPRYVAVRSHHRHVYRLQVRLSSSAAASGLCATLKHHSQVCMRVNA